MAVKKKRSARRARSEAHARQTDLAHDTGVHNARVKLGRNLRRAREARELSQGKLAPAVSLNQSTIAQMEAGAHSPMFETLLLLAHALKTTPKALLHGVKL
jgi:DNA-binding XRE family transcriptional regulator